MKHNDLNIIPAEEITCRRDKDDRLVLARDGETLAVDAHLMPTFPLSNRRSMVVARDRHGEELGLISDISKLDPDSKSIAKDELERVYFMPRIKDIIFAEEKLGVLSLEVETNRGKRVVQIRNVRRSIRKLARDRVIIKDVDGNRYDVRRWTELSPYARSVLMQFI